jgi:NADH-ubiquinone oxidoreductase chain 1
MLSPSFGIFLIICLWGIFPFWGRVFYSNYTLIIFMILSGLSIYFLLGTGWTRFSKYRLIGSYRSVAQAISYEVRIFLILFCFSWFICSYSLSIFNNNQIFNYFFMWRFPLIFIWLLICLAEANRTPFDFSEGESELVSGFNTEYGGGYFSLIFIREYGSILFFSYISSLIFLGRSNYIIVKTFIFSFLFIWIRGSYPRLRYDRLIIIAWKRILPLVLGIIIFIFNYTIW